MIRELLTVATLLTVFVPIARAHEGGMASTQLVDCQATAAIVSTGSPSYHVIDAYNDLLQCSQSVAIPALVTAWTRQVARVERRWREMASTRISDKRLLNAALAVATSSSKPQTERITGLSAVASFIRPGSHLGTTFWNNPTTARLEFVGDLQVDQGEQPITSADRTAALQSLDTMAASDPDANARLVAQRLAALLRGN